MVSSAKRTVVILPLSAVGKGIACPGIRGWSTMSDDLQMTPGHGQSESDANALAFLRGIGPRLCNDCGADMSLVGSLHYSCCPVVWAVQIADERDRSWFAAHPRKTKYTRELLPGDLDLSTLNCVKGAADDSPAMVEVTRTQDGVLTREIQGPITIRLLTPSDGVDLDGAYVVGQPEAVIFSYVISIHCDDEGVS